MTCYLVAAFAEEPYFQLWSQSHWQCLKRCCHQVSASSLNPWAASNYGLYQEALGAGHWGREQCAWHKCQKSQGRLGRQAVARQDKPSISHRCSISRLDLCHSDHEHRCQSAMMSDVGWLMFPSSSTWMFPYKLADLLLKISAASFILKLSIPLSPPLLAALFITCNHNNLSFLFPKHKEFLSPGVFSSDKKDVIAYQNF